MFTGPVPQRGFVLGLVLAFLAGLFFTVLAMHFQSANARAAQLQLESHVQREWAANSDGALLCAQAAGLTTANTDLKESERLTGDTPLYAAARTFKDPQNLAEATPDKLPSWSYGSVLTAHPLNTDQSFLRGKKIKLTFQQFLPYAAYAPRGWVTINQLGYYSGVANQMGAGWPIWLVGGTRLQVSQALAYCWGFSPNLLVPAGMPKFPLASAAQRPGELLRQQALRAQVKAEEVATTLPFFDQRSAIQLDRLTDRIFQEHVHPRTWVEAKVVKHIPSGTNQTHYSVYTGYQGDFPQDRASSLMFIRDFLEQRSFIETWVDNDPPQDTEYLKTVALMLNPFPGFPVADYPTVERMDALVNSSASLRDWIQVLVAPAGRGMVEGAADRPGLWRGTLTVPSGRALSLPGLVLESGDLWLQRGSFLKIGGDLSLRRGPQAWAGLVEGRIVMEEGSTLYVQGNLLARGNRQLGSVLLPTPQGFADGHYANRRRPITRSIFCDGEVNLPFGTRAGLSINDLARSRQETAHAADWIENDLPTRASLCGTGPYTGSPLVAARTSTFGLNPNRSGPQSITCCPSHPLINKMRLLLDRYGLVLRFASNAKFGALLTSSSSAWPFGADRLPIVGRVSHPDQADQLAPMVQLLGSGVGVAARFQNLELDAEKASWTRVCSQFMGDWSRIRDGSITGQQLPLSEAGNEVSRRAASNMTQAARVQIPPTFTSNFLAGDSQPAPTTPLPAEPGVFIRADRITVPAEALKAVGLFVATRQLQMDCLTCIGSLICLDGNIQASGQLLYHPYYTRASVYIPPRQDPDQPADTNTPIGPVLRGRVLDRRNPTSEAATMATDVGLSEGHLTSFEVIP